MHFASLYFYSACYNDSGTCFYTFSSTVFEYVDKTFYIIGIFRHFFIFFILLGIFFFLVFCLCSCDFVSPFYMFSTYLLVLTVIIYQQVLVFFIHANIDKDGNHL